jgi:zinc and cadmium transporter
MLLKLSVLFLTPLLSGLLIFFFNGVRTSTFKLILVFAGGYLFAITVVHILPDLYISGSDAGPIGLFVLAGFFLQQLLEYYTSGIEHGHLHSHHHHRHDEPHEHPATISALVLLVALCVHAFLEGAMLANPPSGRLNGGMNAILLGIALHRAPAAFALMTVLSAQLRSRTRSMPYLAAFSLAAPIGLLVSTEFVDAAILNEKGMIFLYALVSGNFLHISTTIVFESSPEHRFNARKLAVAITGALLAVLVEYVI